MFELEIFQAFEEELEDPESELYGKTNEEVFNIFIEEYADIAEQYKLNIASFNIQFKANTMIQGAGVSRKRRDENNKDSFLK